MGCAMLGVVINATKIMKIKANKEPKARTIAEMWPSYELVGERRGVRAKKECAVNELHALDDLW